MNGWREGWREGEMDGGRKRERETRRREEGGRDGGRKVLNKGNSKDGRRKRSVGGRERSKGKEENPSSSYTSQDNLVAVSAFQNPSKSCISFTKWLRTANFRIMFLHVSSAGVGTWGSKGWGDG